MGNSLARDSARVYNRVQSGGDQHLVRQDEEVGKSTGSCSQNRQNGKKGLDGDHYESG